MLTLDTIEESAAITVTPRVGEHSRNHHFPTAPQISPACSTNDRTSRCRRLYIESSTAGFVVLAPLQNAVGFISFRYEVDKLLPVNKGVLSITERLQIDRCVPLEIILYQEQPMVLCLNERQLMACFIALNHSDTSQSSLGHCVHLPPLHTVVTYQQVSNFVYYPETEEVLFAFQGVIHGIRIERLTIRPYVSLQDNTCDHIVYYGDHVIYAYCRSGVVFEYNIDEESLIRHLPRDGVPIPCPSPHMGFMVIQGEQGIIARHGSGIELSFFTRGNFSFAICSPSGVLYIFNHLGNVTVVNATSKSSRPVDRSIHSRYLEVFGGDYLVVQTDSPQRVLLYDSALDRIVEKSGEVQAVGVIANLTIPTTKPKPSTTPAKPMSPPKLAAGVWVGIAFSSVMAVIIITVIVFSVLLLVIAGIVLSKKKG